MSMTKVTDSIQAQSNKLVTGALRCVVCLEIVDGHICVCGRLGRKHSNIILQS